MNLNLNKLKPFQPKRQINSHHVSDTVSIDDIIDYTVNTYEIGMNDDDDDDDAKVSASTDSLQAHIAARSLSLGDIHHVLAAKQKSDKGRNWKVNASESERGRLKLGDTTYFLNKGETIMFNGQQYSAHVTMLHYSVGQHDVATMEKALVVAPMVVFVEMICVLLKIVNGFLMYLALPGKQLANYML
jgi:hypothetical protein